MKKLLISIVAIICIIACGFAVVACSKVTPAAWVQLDMDGCVYYTTNMYGDHVFCYASQEDASADTHRTNYILKISFSPRILGPDFSTEENDTVVDVTHEVSMSVQIYKNNSVYAENKKVYLNGQALTPKDDLTYDCGYFVSYVYEDIPLVRGNPNGKRNDSVNIIEYK